MVIHPPPPPPPADITLHQIIFINKRSRGAFTLAKCVALASYRSAGHLYPVISAIVANVFKAAAALSAALICRRRMMFKQTDVCYFPHQSWSIHYRLQGITAYCIIHGESSRVYSVEYCGLCAHQGDGDNHICAFIISFVIRCHHNQMPKTCKIYKPVVIFLRTEFVFTAVSEWH